jgi:histidyl-tRNA synthetase
MEPQAWEKDAGEVGLSSRQMEGLLSLLSDKTRWQQSEELVRLFTAIEALGMADYVQFDPNIIRGLLYYTGTVFEGFDVTGSVRRAILGGGRYDNLLRDVGGEPLAGVGFAMGDVVISLILQELGLLPQFPVTPAEVMVTVFSQDLLPESYALSSDLRGAGFNVFCYPEPAKLPRQFKVADRMKIRAVLVVGPDEATAGKVTVKDLTKGAQETVNRGEVIEFIRKLLDGH